ncbi:MAG: hypothetical protein KDA97_14205 [Acidimicrobiales bacterium]|nr:hypothetical protein [Acidimicrobiales bacterium]
MATSDCCQTMSDQLAFMCTDHPDSADCPDKLVAKWASGDHVLLVHDGGSSGIVIAFCPWCGQDLGATT